MPICPGISMYNRENITERVITNAASLQPLNMTPSGYRGKGNITILEFVFSENIHKDVYHIHTPIYQSVSFYLSN